MTPTSACTPSRNQNFVPVLRARSIAVKNKNNKTRSSSSSSPPPKPPAMLVRLQNYSDDSMGDDFKGKNKSFQYANGSYITFSALALKLAHFLGFGYSWIFMVVRLGLYALLLLPAFLNSAYEYVSSVDIKRGVRYAPFSRSTLDIYSVPKNCTNKDNKTQNVNCNDATSLASSTKRVQVEQQSKPIVILVPGGAWIIGYKAWAYAIGKTLSQHGCICIAIDYRNFPQGNLSDMLTDCSNAIAWTFKHASSIGGDPCNVSVLGQSAGAHIASLCLIQQARWQYYAEFRLNNTQARQQMKWRCNQVARFIGVSGAYDILYLADQLHRRGMYRDVLHRMMEGNLATASPTLELLRHCAQCDAAPFPSANRPSGKKSHAIGWHSLLPPINLFHGNLDKTVPHESSEQFAIALRMRNVEVSMTTLEDRTHTDPIVEDYFRGENPLMEAVIKLITGHTVKLSRQPLTFKLSLRLARFVNPF